MTEVQRSASGGGVGSSDFCIRAELAQGRVHAAARIQLSERPLRRSGSQRRRRPLHAWVPAFAGTTKGPRE